MAISTAYFQEWAVSEIEARRGAEWYKQGVDKEICVKIFNTCPFGDLQWLSVSKLRVLLREAKRDIREELDPALRERREAKEEASYIKLHKETVQKQLNVLKEDKEERTRQLRDTREHGHIGVAEEGDVCFYCGKCIENGKRCLIGKRSVFYQTSLTLCLECIKADQHNRHRVNGQWRERGNLSEKVEERVAENEAVEALLKGGVVRR